MSKDSMRSMLHCREQMYTIEMDDAVEIASRCKRVHDLEWPPTRFMAGIDGGELVYATAVSPDWPGIQIS